MSMPELVSRIVMSPLTMWTLFGLGMAIAARRIHD